MEIFVLIVLVGLIPAAIAHAKGHHFIGWWIFGSLLFIVALPMALLAKPDRDALERRTMYEKGMRKCPGCAELIPCEAAVCRFCGRDVEPAPLPGGAGAHPLPQRI